LLRGKIVGHAVKIFDQAVGSGNGGERVARRLLLLNGLAAIFAVVHHSVHWVLTGMFWWADRYKDVVVPDYSSVGSLSYYVIRLVDQLAFVAVPVFLLVSGFFVASTTARNASKLSWKMALNRVRYLLVPYLIWTAVILVLRTLEGDSYTPLMVGSIVLLGTASAAYYYVPLLIILYLLSPILALLAKKHWKLLLLGTVLIQIPQFVARYTSLLTVNFPWGTTFLDLFRDWHLVEFAFWFVLGIVIGFHLPETKRFLSRYRRMIFIGMIVTFIVGLVEWELVRRAGDGEWPSTTILFGNKVYALFFLLTCLAYTDVKIPLTSQLNKIGARSYGIYLIHMIVLEVVARATYHVLPQLFAFPVVFLVILTVMGTAVPYMLMELVNRFPVRRYYVHIFG
jgi:surface polysaccharide O-acyltransferase-like enzyme